MNQVEYVNQAAFATAVADIRARKWIVGSLNADGNFSFSARPVRHSSQIQADEEAARLAKNNPGTVYVSVRLTGGRLVPKVIGVSEF